MNRGFGSNLLPGKPNRNRLWPPVHMILSKWNSESSWVPPTLWPSDQPGRTCSLLAQESTEIDARSLTLTEEPKAPENESITRVGQHDITLKKKPFGRDPMRLRRVPFLYRNHRVVGDRQRVVISTCNHARAKRHMRSAVAGDTPNAAAAWSPVCPAK